MKQFEFIYNLLNLKGIGRVKANKILQNFNYKLQENNLCYEDLKIELSKYFSDEDIANILYREFEYTTKPDIPAPLFINRFQEKFPINLNELKNNCPPIISCIGNLELFNNKKVGFCGSRKASNKGLEVAKDISQQVSKMNIAVVSGYASGIDIETHYWSLKEGGKTIIVLPEGINNFSIKRKLKDVWDWNRVLVISEFLPNAIWSINRAMQRNTTIITLSNVMFLIEAKINGGSIDAGNKTLNMHKPLFAPIYQGMPEEAKGNEYLLKKGAHPLRKKRKTNKANLDKVFYFLEKMQNEKSTLF